MSRIIYDPKDFEIRFQEGELLFHEGDPSHTLYVIKSGQIEIFRKGPKPTSARIPIGIIGSGEYIGELSLLSNRVHTNSAVALTEVVALQLKGDAFEEQLKHAPTWIVALVRGLASKLQHSNNVVRRNTVMDTKLLEATKAVRDKQRKRKA